MLTKILSLSVRIATLVTLLSLAVNDLTNSNLQAQTVNSGLSKIKVEYIPPRGSGIPKDPTTAGGTRPIDCTSIDSCLVALLPTSIDKLNYYPLTISERPTFFVNVPKVSGDAIFTLYQDSPSGFTQIFRSHLPIKTNGGIIKVSLPSSAPALEANKTYEWSLSVNNQTTRGLVSRVQLNSILAQKIKLAQPLEKVAIYAAEGIWYDSLEILSNLRTSQPQDPKVLSEWSEFLNSVNSSGLAKQRISDCCLFKN